MNLVWGTVVSADIDHCTVEVDGREGTARAIAYPDLVGPVAAADRVLLNTTAVDLELGTGGDHFIVAVIAEGKRPEGVAFSDESGGHMMKLRYTPLQRDVLACEAPEASSHTIMKKVSSLEDIPVVCCGLHSQVPIVAATVKAEAPHLRVGYIMTDQAALHLDYSHLIKQCVESGLLDATITVGQALGGQYEAINLYSGLLCGCHVCACDVLIVAIGPGVAGTATPFGNGGIAQGEAINAVTSLGGRPIATLRMSFADKRERHQGISHHTLTALEVIAHAPAILAIPALSDKTQRQRVDEQLDTLDGLAQHQGVFFDELMFDQAHLGDIEVTTMGRGYADDPVFFEAAASAGMIAAQIGTVAAEQAISDFLETKNPPAGEDGAGCQPSSCASCPLTCDLPPTSVDDRSPDSAETINDEPTAP
ncbi:MAG: DUF3866 family protein [Coriobacteriia bacterium]|nr:DUF3866 family protein [Coriobacteriia bacterium]